MLNFDKEKAVTLFALTLLTASLFVNVNMPVSAQLSDVMHLDGPSLTPIHMHSNITLNPIHMHHTKGILWPGEWPITEPNCTTDWRKIAPDQDPPFEVWHLSSWEDLGDPIGELSPNDQIDMTNIDTEEVQWFHVDRMTLTLNLSGPYTGPTHEPGPTSLLLELKWPYYDPYIIYGPLGTVWHEVWPRYSSIFKLGNWADDPQNLNGMLDYTDSVSFDGGISWWHVEDVATDLILRWKMLDPIGTWWHELYPEYCEWYELTSWESFPDPYCDRISPRDTIDMFRLSSQTTHWYFVDRVTITINVSDVESPGNWMMLELKTHYFEEMYYYLKHPLGSFWHEVYPDYSTVFNLTWWDPMDPYWDNCNGVLDPCDYIVLTNQTDGLDRVYHIDDMAYDIILNEYITNPDDTRWHELWPECTVYEYDIVGFSDNGDGWLSPCDNVTLALIPTGATEEYHVENVTLTLNITVEDVAGVGPIIPGERIYLEYIPIGPLNWSSWWPLLYHPKIEPWDTEWEIVCPIDYFGERFWIWNWWDNCNGVLSYCDWLELAGASQDLYVHVDEVAVDIIVKKLAPTPVHDVAVIDVYSIYDWVYQGDIDPINVTVENQGDFTESVDVTAYYDGTPAAPTQVVVLDPGDVVTLTFNWDTTGVPPGPYSVSATAIIPIDDDPNDNSLTGNTEVVRLRPPWYMKPPYPDYAPVGMPDFDQRQMGTYWWNSTGVWTLCGPTAVANSLWWLDSEFEPNTIPPPTIIDNFPLVQTYGPWDDHDPLNVPWLVEHLAYLMDTDGQRTSIGHMGTDVLDMQAGITHYLSWSGVNPLGDVDGDGNVTQTDLNIVNAAFGTIPGVPGWDLRADIYPVTQLGPYTADNVIDAFDVSLVSLNMNATGQFYEHTAMAPLWDVIQTEVEKCQDVVLLLMPWYWDDIAGDWYRFDEGGHFVTVAGLNGSHAGTLADPWEIVFSDPIRDNAEAGFPGDVPIPHVHTPPEPPYITHNDAMYVSHDMYHVILDPCPGGPLTIVDYLGGAIPPPGQYPQWRIQIEAAVITSPYLAGDHDVAVINVTTSKTGCLPMETVGKGQNVTVYATVENQGISIETFNTTAYANANISIVIGEQQVTLNPGQNQTLTFVWVTTGVTYGNYTIEAIADTVPSEIDTADNTFTDGTVLITITGDIDGNRIVNIFDIVRICGKYMMTKPDPNWDPNADIIEDGLINIFDVVAAATHYMQSW